MTSSKPAARRASGRHRPRRLARGLRLKTKSHRASTGMLVSVAAAVALLYVFRSILWPLAFAIVITIVIQSVLHAVLKVWPRANRQIVLLLGGAAALGALFWGAVVVLPALSAFVRNLPAMLALVDAALLETSNEFGLENPITLQILFAGLDARAVALWMLGGLRGLVSGLVLTALFVIFLLISWDLIGERIRLGGGRRALAVVERSLQGVEVYLWIQTLTGLMNAGAAALVMFCFGLDHWLLWAAAYFLLAYIPFLGVAIGSIAPALAALLQFPSAAPSIVIFLAIQAVAFVVGNLVAPRLTATAQNLDPNVALLAIAAWSIIWGLPGAFLGIPLTLALVYLLAADRNLAWLAILMSNDGFPLRRKRRAR